MPSPAFQFYPDDFVGSGVVQAAEADEIGAYVLLLCLDWGEQGFVFEEKRLARVCRLSVQRFRVVWSHLAAKFPARDGRHYNTRLDKERVKQAEWRDKSAKGGAASAAKRGKGGASLVGTVVEPPLVPDTQPTGNTPVSSLQSPSPLQKQTTLPASRKKREPGAVEAAPRVTWLTPIGEAWDRENGAGSFPYGQAAKELKPLRDAGHSPEAIARYLGWYLKVRGLDTLDPDPAVILRTRFSPSLRDFRLRFAKFNPERAA